MAFSVYVVRRESKYLTSCDNFYKARSTKFKLSSKFNLTKMPTYPIAPTHERTLDPVLCGINLNQEIIGQERDRQHLHTAKATAAVLRGVKGKCKWK